MVNLDNNIIDLGEVAELYWRFGFRPRCPVLQGISTRAMFVSLVAKQWQAFFDSALRRAGCKYMVPHSDRSSGTLCHLALPFFPEALSGDWCFLNSETQCAYHDQPVVAACRRSIPGRCFGYNGLGHGFDVLVWS